MTTTIQSKLVHILDDKFGAAATNAVSDASLEEVGMDSLAIVELGLEIQKQFNVSIEEGEITPDTTISELTELVTTKGAE